MADIDKTTSARVQQGTFGNKWQLPCTFKPAAATVAGDKVLLAKIDAGTLLTDAVAFVEDALATLTLSLGYRHINGEAGDDEAFFFSAKDVAAGGKFRADVNKPPKVVQYDSYLVATLGGAAFPTTNQLDVVVDYDYEGPVSNPS